MNFYRVKQNKYLAVFVLLSFFMSFSITLVAPAATAMENTQIGGHQSTHGQPGGDDRIDGDSAEIRVVTTFVGGTPPSIFTCNITVFGSLVASVNSGVASAYASGVYFPEQLTNTTIGYDATAPAGYALTDIHAHYGLEQQGGSTNLHHPLGTALGVPFEMNNQGGSLAGQPLVEGDYSDAEIHVTYSQIIQPDNYIQITKTITNTTGNWPTQIPVFEFKIYAGTDTNAGPVATTSIQPDPPAGTYTNSTAAVPVNVGKGTSFTIVETTQSNWTCLQSSQSVSSTNFSGTTPTAQVTFTNAYVPPSPPVRYIQLSKSCTGWVPGATAQAFQFIIEEQTAPNTWIPYGSPIMVGPFAYGQTLPISIPPIPIGTSTNPFRVRETSIPSNWSTGLANDAVLADFSNGTTATVSFTNTYTQPGTITVTKNWSGFSAPPIPALFLLFPVDSFHPGNISSLSDLLNLVAIFSNNIMPLAIGGGEYSGSFTTPPLNPNLTYAVVEINMDPANWLCGVFNCDLTAIKPLILTFGWYKSGVSPGQSVTFTNTASVPTKRTITITKEDQSGNKLAASFLLKVGDYAVKTIQTDATTGTYTEDYFFTSDVNCTIQEVAPNPNPYYKSLLDGDSLNTNLLTDAKGFTMGANGANLKVVNYKYGDLTITKDFVTGTNQALKGCTITLTGKTGDAAIAPTTKSHIFTTDEESFKFDSLPDGTYEITESCPTGFVSDAGNASKKDVTISATSLSQSLTWQNNEQTGYLEIDKILEDSTNTDWSGFDFTVTDPDGLLIGTGTSDADGNVLFDSSSKAYCDSDTLKVRANLKYLVKETDAQGYFSSYTTGNGCLSNTVEEGKTELVEVTNKKLPDDSIVVVKKWLYGEPSTVTFVLTNVKTSEKIYSDPIKLEGETFTFAPGPGTYTLDEIYGTETAPMTGYKWINNLDNTKQYVINADRPQAAQVVEVTNTHPREVTITKDFTGNQFTDTTGKAAVITIDRQSGSQTPYDSIMSGAIAPWYWLCSVPVTIALHDGDSSVFLGWVPYDAYVVQEVGIFNDSDLEIGQNNLCTIKSGASKQYEGLYSVSISSAASDSYNNGSFMVTNTYNTSGGNTTTDENTPSTNTYTGTSTTVTAPEETRHRTGKTAADPRRFNRRP